MIKRLAYTALLLISVCAFPLCLSITLGILGLVLFSNFYEIIPIFFVADVLYGVPLHRFSSFMYVMTIAGLLGVLVSVWVRTMFFRK